MKIKEKKLKIIHMHFLFYILVMVINETNEKQ